MPAPSTTTGTNGTALPRAYVTNLRGISGPTTGGGVVVPTEGQLWPRGNVT